MRIGSLTSQHRLQEDRSCYAEFGVNSVCTRVGTDFTSSECFIGCADDNQCYIESEGAYKCHGGWVS